MNTKYIWFVGAALFLIGCNSAESDEPVKPRLILQITVDQLRADLPESILDRVPEGGFRYLYENGIVYKDAHHPHANTETVVGHTTLATGAYPSDHGMVGNLWFDKALNRLVYNVEDWEYPLVGASTGVDKDTEIDPTQAAAGTDGRSPKTILGTTFSDELFKATDGQAKIFGVSVKDRGAITLAGHNGKAFWFSKSSGDFISSTYYYEEYPDWVTQWNDADIPATYANTTWELSQDENTYVYKNTDDPSYKTKFPGFDVTFPHNFGPSDSPYFNTFLTLSPAGDELTLDFTKKLIEAEEIGKDEITDFLAVSFSSTDYVNHIFGPSSIECEDNLFRLDRTIAGLLAYVDQTVGLENTFVVLSADHGGVDAPAVMQAKGTNAGYIDVSGLKVAVLNELVKEALNIDHDVISSFFYPYVYFYADSISESGIDDHQVFSVLKPHLELIEGIQEAVLCKTLAAGQSDGVYEQLLHNYHPQRSGDIAIIVEPYWYINDFDGLEVASTHGSPWAYDTHVPIIFAGKGIKPAVIERRVETIDIAPTLSDYLNIPAPSNASGAVLEEIR